VVRLFLFSRKGRYNNGFDGKWQTAKGNEIISVAPIAYTIFTKSILIRGGINYMNRGEIFKLIEKERERQEILHPIYESSETENSEVKAITTMINNSEFLAILVEELGEVGSALQGEGDLKDELVQVASVCVRWLENMK
jgi:hypothetical protein